ncbi:hypothetical protein JHK82_012452 [Glycine max]|uniref:BED-type domain-containing protein n=2 Tax=Glycine subgen. Soja TaxID=1462606 RepID=K7KP98_SOYBN|nr:hypothetical protein JHK85_012807 [Glycine max]KAG5057477.1 hypothetical protein JHK86_012473 [Glycine max]KAG5154483.1 hypothetical protein JHK82_012452 [Glycine max]KAH1133633.1 hypothetical protein GYH30_012164 [Glycine max]RZC11780.1 hypothetical protein D0Y65_011824 [Glycine soja]
MLPPHSSVGKTQSNVWDHFTEEPGPNLEKKARSNYCEGLIKFENGTTAMWNHLDRCKKRVGNMSKKQISTSSMKNASFPSLPKKLYLHRT